MSSEVSATRSKQDAINDYWLSSEHLQEGLGGRARRGGAIAVVAQVSRVALQILAAAALSRLLAPEDFGLFAMGGTVMAFISVFTEMSVSTATIQRDKLDQDTVSALLLINIGMGLLTVLIAGAASPAATSIFHNPDVPMVVIGIALSVPVNMLGSQHYALLNRHMRWYDVQIVSLGAMAIGIVAAILAAWTFDARHWALVVQAMATAVAGSGLAWLRCSWRPSIVRDWKGAKESLGFGINLTGAMIMNYFHRQLDNVLVGWRWGAVELGFYTRAYSLLLTPLNFVSGPLGSAMIPALSRLQNDPVRWRTAYLDALSIVSIIGAGMACVLYGGAGPIIDLVLGPGWGKSEVIFSYLVITVLTATPMMTTGWIYISLARTNRMFHWSLIGPPMYVVAFLIGLPHGASGLAFAYAISQVIAFLPCMWMAIRDTNITMKDILVLVAPPTAVAIAIGLGLRAVTGVTGPIMDFVAIAFAGALFVAVMGLIVWRSPAHTRLRELSLKTLSSLRARIESFRAQRA